MKTLNLTDAKNQLPKLIKGVQRREDQFVVTRNGKPVAVVMAYDEYISLTETLEVLADPVTMNQIKKSRAYFKKHKKGVPLDSIFGAPSL